MSKITPKQIFRSLPRILTHIQHDKDDMTKIVQIIVYLLLLVHKFYPSNHFSIERYYKYMRHVN